MPAGAPGVVVELRYPRAAGVLDLGLIDPLGWRGWSGGARDLIEIGPEHATPGYLNRGVPAGRWAVVLGLHRLPRDGIPYEVAVELRAPASAPRRPRPDPPARRPPRELPAQDGMRWLAGDLHSHTVHSDGGLEIDELAVLAAQAGLDFLAVTDHNTVSHHPVLNAVGRRYGIDLLPGQEVTTADGHANAYGDIGWVDFRRPAAWWQAEVSRRGGVFSVNHPVAGDCSWRQMLPTAPSAAEVWHSSWRDRRDGGSLAWWAAAGYAPTPVGGSDWHRLGSEAPPGSPTTWVACADGDVLTALAAGRTAVSASRDGPVLLRVGDELVALDADGAGLVCPEGRRTPVRGDRASYAGHPAPHLLETDDRTVLAICA